MGTTFALKVQQVITGLLGSLGITASYSPLYVIIAWTAVGVMLAATLLRIIGRYTGAGIVEMARKPHPAYAERNSGQYNPYRYE